MRRCKACGLNLPASAFALTHAHPSLPGRRGFDTSTTIRVRRKTCRECVGKTLGQARDRANAKKPRRATGELVPCSCCGRKKPWGLEEFRNCRGLPWQPCKRCHCLRVQLHRNTPKGRAALRRYLASEKRAAARKRHEASPKRKAQRERWEAKHPLVRKAHNLLRSAVRRGEIKKPEHCPFCGRKKALSASFRSGYEHPLDVVFACQKCHRRARGLGELDDLEEAGRMRSAARTARKYGVPLELADRLTITPKEWRQNYEAALTEARHDVAPAGRFDYPVVDPGLVYVDVSPFRQVDLLLLQAMGYRDDD